MTHKKSLLLLGTLIPVMVLSQGTFAAPSLQLAQAPSADDERPDQRRQRSQGAPRPGPGGEQPAGRPAPGQPPAARPTAPERPAASAPTAPRPPAAAPQAAPPTNRAAPAETEQPRRSAPPAGAAPGQIAPSQQGAPRTPSAAPQRSAPGQIAPPTAPSAPAAPRATQPAAPTAPQAAPSRPTPPPAPSAAPSGATQPNAAGAPAGDPQRRTAPPSPTQSAPGQPAPSGAARATTSQPPAAPNAGRVPGAAPQSGSAPTQSAPTQPPAAAPARQPAPAAPTQTAPAAPTQAAPAPAAPTQAAPTQSAPAGASQPSAPPPTGRAPASPTQPGAAATQSAPTTGQPAGAAPQPGLAPSQARPGQAVPAPQGAAPGQAGQQFPPGQPATSGQPLPAPERQGRRGGIGLGGAAAIGLGAAAIGGIMATQGADRLDEVRSRREERREGDYTIIREPGRTIIRDDDNRAIIRRDETQRFRDLGLDTRSERRGEETVTIYDRPDGTQIVTVTDSEGRLLRRSRRQRDGAEFVIIDNVRRDGPRPRFAEEVVELPPPPLRIPRERYIVDAERADERLIYETITAPPVAPVPRRYTLDEVRYSPDLRAHMRSVDVDTINFDSGSWIVTPDQAGRLRVIAQAVRQAVERAPNEVFMVEGHTDAVGSDIDNLSLSDRRAQSVAEILTRDFGVPAENLTTQGYGEQYPKVQTQEAARENRRVTLRRITPLLTGQNQQ